MNEKKLAHLKMIQATIIRMDAHSSLLRAWTITLVAGVFALAAKDADIKFILIAYIPTIMFWVLDGFYLNQERLFRELYDSVAAKDENAIDFSMNTSGFTGSWAGAMVSITLLIFYGAILGIIILVMFAFPYLAKL
ncbi:MAG: hypothetical protein K8T91_18745 [Planctomycetes bacterium]|nr:hypothetical protein [Planctomycetota bacterium]